jgi:5-formyltetrahydrofolate cyclo-ligase
MEKKEIRKLILQNRKKLNKKLINKNSFLINKKIIQTINLINKTIGLYFPINNEINLDIFFNLKKLKLFFPKIEINKNNLEKNKMYFCGINSDFLINKKNKNLINFNSKKIKNNFLKFKKIPQLIFENKIIQPKFKKNTLIPEIIIIPLVAFNEKCFRVGYGGGFYDKYLKNKKILKIGVAFEFQKIHFKNEKHDIPLDYIFTEKRIYRRPCKNIFQI